MEKCNKIEQKNTFFPIFFLIALQKNRSPLQHDLNFLLKGNHSQLQSREKLSQINLFCVLFISRLLIP